MAVQPRMRYLCRWEAVLRHDGLMMAAGGSGGSRTSGRPRAVAATASVDQLPSPAWKRAGLALEDRVARGKAARKSAPRSSHGKWEPASDRPDPVALLQEQAESRVPELVPIRYGRMLVSPGTFYRGAALIMASDLAQTSRSGIVPPIPPL